ncbi:MAG: rRNA maturation RNase YbeY [Vicinamibacterales bacterium]
MPSSDADPPLARPALRSTTRRAAKTWSIDVVDRQGRPADAPGLAAWLARTVPPRVAGHLTIALVSDAEMKRLNLAYRGADYATDVLSFPSEDTTAPPAGDRRVASRGRQSRTLGDVVIARGVAARQARVHGHSLRTELRVLALHGLLHLLGYDHEADDGRMAAVEARLRRRGGLRSGLIERHRS